MIIVESNQEINEFLKKWDNYPSLVVPIWCDLEKHPLNNKLSFLYIHIEENDYIINFNHIDAGIIDIDLSKSQQTKWVWNKKGLLQTNLNLQNIFDLSSYLFFNQNKLFDLNLHEQSFIYHYRRTGIRGELGKLVPIMKWGEFLKESFSPFISLQPQTNWIDSNMIPILSDIERLGIRVDREKFFDRFPNSSKHLFKDKIYTEYNPYTITSRPSNRHGGINFGALNKKDGTREVFIPKKDHIFLQFDYDAYHPRIIGKLIGYDLPKTSVHQWLAEQYGMDYDEGKGRTFRILYGGVSEEDKTIEFFEQVDLFIQKLWKEIEQNGYLKTGQGRKIPLHFIENPNPQKVFNYLLQATETEFNIEVLRLLKSKGYTLPLLYQYDSFLFEYGSQESTDRAKSIKEILESYGFPVKASWGTNYSEV